MVGAFPVKRDTADVSALKVALNLLKRGNALAVFPEGSRRINGISSEPQGGIGFIASKTNVPIIPSFIKGTDLALPKGAKFIRPRRISIYFGQQILVERRKPNNYQDIAREIMGSIRRISCHSIY
jgi:1-acyl-sn-glycerol-3-phosphate acyltransferase